MQYTSVAAMMIESIVLPSIASTPFLVLFGTGSAVSHVFLQSLSRIQARFRRIANDIVFTPATDHRGISDCVPGCERESLAGGNSDGCDHDSVGALRGRQDSVYRWNVWGNGTEGK